jgi:hypothetical protein
MAVEIRVIDTQECPRADLAVAALVVGVLKALVAERWRGLEELGALEVADLERVFLASVSRGDEAVLDDRAYLAALGLGVERATLKDVWRHLFESCMDHGSALAPTARSIVEGGPLARRILAALGPRFSPARLHEVYGRLCDCLAQDELFA